MFSCNCCLEKQSGLICTGGHFTLVQWGVGVRVSREVFGGSLGRDGGGGQLTSVCGCLWETHALPHHFRGTRECLSGCAESTVEVRVQDENVLPWFWNPPLAAP